MISKLAAVALASAEPVFVVLNDLHMHATYQGSANRLEWFCKEALPAIQASADLKFIVLNGDLTDGGFPFLSLEGPGERPKEWELLETGLAACMQSALVFPIRGNHDAFHVEAFDHASNHLFLNFQALVDKSNAAKGVVVDRYPSGGSYLSKLGPQTLLFLDCAQIGRHFFAVYSRDLDSWVRAKLEAVTVDKSVTIFSHFPTGTFLPDDRIRLLATIREFSRKITAYHSGHVHFKYGWRAQTEHEGIQEFELVDFAYAGYARVSSLDASVIVDFTVSDKKLPLLGATRQRDGAS